MKSEVAKNFFAYQLEDKRSANGDETHFAGEEFVVRRVGAGLAQKQTENADRAARLFKMITFPIWLNAVIGCIFLVGLSIFLGALESLTDGIPFEELAGNGFWYYIGFGGGAILLTAVAFLVQLIMRRRTLSSPDYEEFLRSSAKLKRESIASMSVPEGAVAVDIFTVYRRNRFGRWTIAGAAKFQNEEFFAFRDGDALCLADEEVVVRIPYEKIVRVFRVERNADFMNWNKEERPVKGKYHGYKIRANQYGVFFVAPYYAVEIAGKEGLELVFPPYEFETLAPLLGSKAMDVETRK